VPEWALRQIDAAPIRLLLGLVVLLLLLIATFMLRALTKKKTAAEQVSYGIKTAGSIFVLTAGRGAFLSLKTFEIQQVGLKAEFAESSYVDAIAMSVSGISLVILIFLIRSVLREYVKTGVY